ncbi:MAG: hypothetical protein C0485_00440 [Pirellula sp.]|nr:hypothetical protein [Pirellula sp.]
MRLTLRTLLAYMDDVLDPADQEDLGRKIESSPFATELIHRSRDAVRRLRLSAPEVLAAESGDLHGDAAALDANTTSEYLDSTLSPDAVADFERSCLEAGNNADMLLAEAASCHHILTMVLGEPAEVDADLRQRLYALAQAPAAAPQQLRIEPSHATPTNSSVTPPIAAAAVAPPVTPRPPQVDPDEAAVPDYMLAAVRQRRRSQRAIMAALLAFVIGGVAVWLAWPQKPVETPSEVAELGDIEDITGGVDVGDLETPAAESSTTSSTAAAPATGATAPAETDEAPAFTPSTTPTLPPLTSGAGEMPAAPAEGTIDALPLDLPTAPGAEVAGAIAAETDAAMAGVETPPATGETTSAVATEPTPSAAEGVVPDASDMTLGPAAEATAAEPATPAADAAMTADASAAPTPTAPTPPAASGETTPTPGEAAAVDAAAGPVLVADASGAMKPEAAPVPAVGSDPFPPGASASAEKPAEAKPIGAYLGNNDVLLRFDAKQNVWTRVAPRTPITAGETLMSLPTFRTHVVLADANVYLSGGAEVEVLAPGAGAGTAAGEFGLRIPYGQVVLNSGLNGNRIDLSLVDQDRLAQLGPSSSLAVEVRRVFVPGPATNRQPAPVEASWYLTSGSIEWNGEKVEAPATWTTVDGADSAPVGIENLPEWVDREPITAPERSARDAVAEALVPGEPVNIKLLELSDRTARGRRTEDRALAARSGAYVGLYDALVNALNDTSQRASWRAQIDELRQAIARDPSAADGIAEAFALERGQDAAEDLMEMLFGFDAAAVGTTRDEVKNGALVRIIRWMDDDDLTYRVLASYNWDEITGKRLFGNYRPEQNDSQRERALRHHWDRLEKGELTAVEPKK